MKKKSMALVASSVALLVLLSGCANKPYPNDPLEHFNRNAYKFNDKVDTLVYKPVARAYNELPSPARKGVNNFFNNMDEIPTTLNFVLQLDFPRAFLSGWRLIINTTVGLGGLFDPATSMGLQRDYTDLGLTFARWGFRDAPYLVLPFLGPSTFRDAIAWPINIYYLSAWPYIRPASLSIGLFALDLVNFRANLLTGEDVARQASLDPYVFMRDAYLQQRAGLMKHESLLKEEKAGKKDSAAIGNKDDRDTWENL